MLAVDSGRSAMSMCDAQEAVCVAQPSGVSCVEAAVDGFGVL